MIQIKVTGRVDLIKYCETDQEAYLFLVHIKDSHDLFLHPFIKHLIRPAPYYYHLAHAVRMFGNIFTGPSHTYQKELREIVKPHAIKIEITHLPDEDYDLI